MQDMDPNSITKNDMENLADGIEEYLDCLKDIIIFPDELKREVKPKMKRAMKTVEELIKKLRKGDKSVFKDEEEWTSITE